MRAPIALTKTETARPVKINIICLRISMQFYFTNDIKISENKVKELSIPTQVLFFS